MIRNADPIETSELLAFVRIVEAKSVSRAAAELGVPRATVGRRLSRLEGRLGARLLRRTTRSLALTTAGEAFYRRARIALEAVADAEASVLRESEVMRGTVRVSLPMAAAESLMDIITTFAAKHPAVKLEVHYSTRLVDLIREGYDVAVRATGELAPGLVARMLGRTKVVAVAAPAYLAKHGPPRTVKDLRKHRCLTGFSRGELPESAWRVGRGAVHVESTLSSNNLLLVRAACLRGLGIALLPESIVGDLVARGKLVRVLARQIDAENRVAIVYPEREVLAPHVRAFVDALAEWRPYPA